MSKFITKFEEKPVDKFGKDPNKRTMSELLERGFVNVDKHSGPTSHECVDLLKDILEINKAGHSGTLDPKVTGVLLVGLGKGTRLMEYMLESNKEYVCHMYVHKPITDKQLKDVIKNFTGKIMQTPPIKSAVKREEREREIYSIKLLDTNSKNQDILFRVACEHGTYIRMLCHDMGETLGVGAQMKELRRTKAGPITENDYIISLDKLKSLWQLHNEEKNKSKIEKEIRKYVRPYEYLLKDLKKVYVRNSAVNSVSHGSDLAIPGISKFQDDIEIGDEIALLTLHGELIGIGIAYMDSKQMEKKKKGAAIKAHKVFMDVEQYPKNWKWD
jgi:H/ACA ribonucleoprotein complex subunit 4